MDGVADQFARPLRQFFRDVGGHGEHHVLELPEPARAILRGDDEARAIRAIGAAAVRVGRGALADLVIASDPDGIVSLTESVLSPLS